MGRKEGVNKTRRTDETILCLNQQEKERRTKGRRMGRTQQEH